MNHSDAASAPTPISAQTCWSDVLRDGTRVTIRPVREDDVERERAFIMALSPQSRRLRFLGQIGQPSDTLLKQLTRIDPDNDAAFAAVGAGDPEARFLGVGRFSVAPGGDRCEVAIAVLDDRQQLGLGTILMKHLIEVARSRGIGSMYSYDTAENSEMAELAAHLGFERCADCDDASMVTHTLRL
jgi:GNAT superfamily N-acetyltransferase